MLLLFCHPEFISGSICIDSGSSPEWQSRCLDHFCRDLHVAMQFRLYLNGENTGAPLSFHGSSFSTCSRWGWWLLLERYDRDHSAWLLIKLQPRCHRKTSGQFLFALVTLLEKCFFGLTVEFESLLGNHRNLMAMNRDALLPALLPIPSHHLPCWLTPPVPLPARDAIGCFQHIADFYRFLAEPGRNKFTT